MYIHRKYFLGGLHFAAFMIPVGTDRASELDILRWKIRWISRDIPSTYLQHNYVKPVSNDLV